MTIASVGLMPSTLSKPVLLVAGLALFAFAATSTKAQIELPQAPAAEVSLSLPDAPSFSTSLSDGEASSFKGPAEGTYPFVPEPSEQIKLPTRRDMTILPEETAHPLTAHDKVFLGLKESVSIFSIVGWSASAGYSHLINGRPNYGTDSAAFGERLGATALRSVTDNLFSVSLFAPLLREDPRYYELGAGHSIFRRFLHGAARSVVTKTDSGRSTPNFSLFAGNLLGSALTNAYYPERDRSAGQTMQTFGASIGGSALGFVINEFLNDALTIAHLRKAD